MELVGFSINFLKGRSSVWKVPDELTRTSSKWPLKGDKTVYSQHFMGKVIIKCLEKQVLQFKKKSDYLTKNNKNSNACSIIMFYLTYCVLLNFCLQFHYADFNYFFFVNTKKNSPIYTNWLTWHPCLSPTSHKAPMVSGPWDEHAKDRITYL